MLAYNNIIKGKLKSTKVIDNFKDRREELINFLLEIIIIGTDTSS